jgi:hypothetical protein
MKVHEILEYLNARVASQIFTECESSFTLKKSNPLFHAKTRIEYMFIGMGPPKAV